MSTRLRSLLLSAVRTDALAVCDDSGWRTRCLHCRTVVGLSVAGEPWRGTTLEHIVPRSWFGKPRARELVALVGGADDARNLALACARCNHQKGRGPDADGPGDARAAEVVARLLNARLARWRPTA